MINRHLSQTMSLVLIIYFTLMTANLVGQSGFGGLVGYNDQSTISGSYSFGAVTGANHVGGLVGLHSGTALNSYSRGDIIRISGSSNNDIGGFCGSNARGKILSCFSTGAIFYENTDNPTDKGFCGGIILGQSYQMSGNYWDTDTSGQTSSAGIVTGRTTDEMTYSYEANTFIDWDFDTVWKGDSEYGWNDGYPFLRWQGSPYYADNPHPVNNMNSISVNLEYLSWEYIEKPLFSNPEGFKVYLSNTDEFSDNYVWIDYIDEQEEYSTSDILPEELDYYTTYYWKVVPSNEIGDTPNTPIWVFRTEHDPLPSPAAEPNPIDEGIDVSIDLQNLEWRYFVSEAYDEADSFRVYFSASETFDSEPSGVISRNEEQTEYSFPLPIELTFSHTYRWKVVPFNANGDADDITVWSFTTEAETSAEIPETSIITGLHNNYPNPFNPNTTIYYSISQETNIELVIYNIKGQAIKTLVNNKQQAGKYELNWNGTDESGKPVGSGVYFYRLITDHYDKINKMVLVK